MIGVCIKYFHENYGGMLQAFATVKMLESRGIDYELIRYKKKLTITEKIRSVPRLFRNPIPFTRFSSSLLTVNADMYFPHLISYFDLHFIIYHLSMYLKNDII